MKQLWPYIKYALDLIFRISSFYKFKLLTISGIAIFFYNYRIFGSVEKAKGSIEISNQNNYTWVEISIIVFLAIMCFLFDYMQNRHSQKIFVDMVYNKDLEPEYRKDAMSKLKEIQ